MTWEDAVKWLVENPEKQDFVRQCYYDEPIKETSERFMRSEEWEGIIDLLGNVKGKRVLEIGAGRGLVCYAFAKSGASVVALEPDGSDLVGTGAMRRLQQSGNVSFEIVETFGESLPFPDESFDIVYCRCVLHHASDLNSMCKEVSRVLKRGGKFLGEREHVINGPHQLEEFLDKHPLHHLYGGEHAYELNEYRAAILGSGNFRKLREIGPYDHKINFLPHSTSAILRQMTADALKKAFIPSGLAEKLSKNDFVFKLYRKSLTWRDKSAGRFYTFLAIK